METFPRYWPFVLGIHRSPVNFSHKGQWRGTLMFSLICARINGWVNNREAGDLRRHRAHDDVIVIILRLRRPPASWIEGLMTWWHKQRVLMHGHQGWNVRHGLCHIYMIYVYIWIVYSFCLFCCLFIIVTTQFVALYKPCKPKPKPSTYDPPDNHPLAEIQRPILRPEPKQQICHQHANTDHFGK